MDGMPVVANMLKYLNFWAQENPEYQISFQYLIFSNIFEEYRKQDK